VVFEKKRSTFQTSILAGRRCLDDP
jgi:hypothetical protein